MDSDDKKVVAIIREHVSQYSGKDFEWVLKLAEALEGTTHPDARLLRIVLRSYHERSGMILPDDYHERIGTIYRALEGFAIGIEIGGVNTKYNALLTISKDMP